MANSADCHLEWRRWLALRALYRRHGTPNRQQPARDPSRTPQATGSTNSRDRQPALRAQRLGV